MLSPLFATQGNSPSYHGNSISFMNRTQRWRASVLRRRQPCGGAAVTTGEGAGALAMGELPGNASTGIPAYDSAS